MPNGTDDQVGFFAPQSKQILLASLRFNFSKMLCDVVLGARAIFAEILAIQIEVVDTRIGEGCQNVAVGSEWNIWLDSSDPCDFPACERASALPSLDMSLVTAYRSKTCGTETTSGK